MYLHKIHPLHSKLELFNVKGLEFGNKSVGGDLLG